MERLGKTILFFLMILFAFPVHADLKVKTYLSSEHMEVGEIVGYTIEFSSDDRQRGPGPNFSPPRVEGMEFQNISQSSSTSVSYNNGTLTRDYTFKYTLNFAAVKEGLVSFPPIDLGLPEKLKTKSLSLRVYKTLPENLQRQRRSQDNSVGGSGSSLMDQIFGRSRRQPQPGSNQPLEFFTEVEVDKTEVYKGEQLIATWFIYVTPGASLGTFDTLRFPTLKGFWKEDVNFASRFYWKNVSRDGKKYMRALLSSYALTPYKEGSYVIDPFELRTVMTKGYFNASRKILKAKSVPVEIIVKPLPQPVPESFSGGVGRFKSDSVRTTANRNALLGEPFELSFRVVGDQSTTKFLKTPTLDLNKNFKIYKAEEDHRFVASKISSYKTFRYSLIPLKEGVFRFPDVKLSFLNPDNGEYYDEYVKLPTYKVLPNDNVPKIDDEIFDDVDPNSEFTEQDQLANLKFKSLTDGSRFFEVMYFRLSGFWTLLILMLAAMGSFILFKKTAYVPPVKESLAFELEKRALQVAKLLQDNKRNQSLSELINILSLLVGAVNGRRYGAEQEIELAVKSLPASLRSSGLRLKELNDELQEMRFGSSLESYTNKAKLEQCLKDFKKLFLEFREYLR